MRRSPRKQFLEVQYALLSTEEFDQVLHHHGIVDSPDDSTIVEEEDALRPFTHQGPDHLKSSLLSRDWSLLSVSIDAEPSDL